MSENNSLEIDQLSLLQFDIYNWPSISNDNDLGILVPLLNSDTWLGDWLVAGIDTLCKPDNTVLLCEIEGHLELINGSLLLVNFDDT